MSAREQAEALFQPQQDVTLAAQNNAVQAHQQALQQWLTAPPDQRTRCMRAVEAAWRRVRQLDCRDQAHASATTLARHHQKLRSTAR